MIEYWPNKQSLKLNNSVAELFFNTRNKLKSKTSNQTNDYLYIDILNNQYKQKLFDLVLIELEKLILDFIELNLQKKDINALNYKILSNFTNIIYNYLFYKNEISNKKNIHNINKNLIIKDSYFNQLIFMEKQLLIEYLLIYLVFGSSYIEDDIFLFSKFFTPYTHVQILFENFIIQISNFIIHNLLNKFFSLSETINFLQKNSLCNYSYISIRSIALFINNLNWQNCINLYINQPKLIYSSRYQVWLISSNGFITKYIYISRLKELNKLSKEKTLFLFFLEIKDVIIPKLENFLIIGTKYILYLLINIFNNIIILSIKIIISYIHN